MIWVWTQCKLQKTLIYSDCYFASRLVYFLPKRIILATSSRVTLLIAFIVRYIEIAFASKPIQICVALGKFATLQASNFTYPIAADRSFYARWSCRYLERGGIWLSCGGRPRR